MTAKEQNNLKPCPFCDSPAHIEDMSAELHGQPDPWFSVLCENPQCAARTNQWYPETAAINAWNARWRALMSGTKLTAITTIPLRTEKTLCAKHGKPPSNPTSKDNV